MYLTHFQLNAAPFSITPDPRFVYLSAQHQDALAHLRFGLGQGGSGGFVVLTGEVGTGKTTLSRLALEHLPANTDAALILNPNLDARELLEAIAQELGILPSADLTDPKIQPPELSAKQLTDRLNLFLLAKHQDNRRVVVILDEAQNLPRDTLEQVRLLTNLETDTQKLLQIILLGQPELNTLLERQDLRQLSQRITARFHLHALSASESASYLTHRLKVAGAQRDIFTPASARLLHQLSRGVPRVLSTLADRALLAAYTRNKYHVEPSDVYAAAQEILPRYSSRNGLARFGANWRASAWPIAAAACLLIAASFALRQFHTTPAVKNIDAKAATHQSVSNAPMPAAPLDAPPVQAALAPQLTQDQIIQSWLQSAGLPITADYLALANRCPDVVQSSARAAPLRCGRGRETASALKAMQPPVLLQTDRGFRLSSSLNDSHSDQRFAFVALYALPENIPQTFGLGYSGPGVPELATKLAQSDAGSTNQRIFGPRMQLRLQTWQQKNGLEADGIAGTSTWIVLGRLGR
jgi:general secretion pathway protein A